MSTTTEIATKDQERKALAQIKKIVEGLGPQSYIATAFDGCFQDAEDNIENDFGCSMKARYESEHEKAVHNEDIATEACKAVTQAAVIATLDNRDITEGFPYRELALMAKDPDTGREGTYLYDNAGQECEYLDTQANGVLIYERLKMLIRVEQAETISFEASGNPLNITWTDIEPILAKKADLGEDGTVVASQLPKMNYESPLKDNAAKDTPVDEDSLSLVDSADSGQTKRVLWSRVKAVLKGYFDNLYARAVHSHAWSAITGKPSTFAPSIHTHPASDLTTVVPVTKGGTGAVTAAGARENLGACALVAPVTVTLAVASWAGSGPWTQTATVSGVTASDNHIGVFPVDVADADARKLYEKAYGCLAAEAETVAGGVKFTCRDAKPEINFDVVIKGVR